MKGGGCSRIPTELSIMTIKPKSLEQRRFMTGRIKVRNDRRHFCGNALLRRISMRIA